MTRPVASVWFMTLPIARRCDSRQTRVPERWRQQMYGVSHDWYGPLSFSPPPPPSSLPFIDSPTTRAANCQALAELGHLRAPAVSQPYCQPRVFARLWFYDRLIPPTIVRPQLCGVGSSHAWPTSVYLDHCCGGVPSSWWARYRLGQRSTQLHQTCTMLAKHVRWGRACVLLAQSLSVSRQFVRRGCMPCQASQNKRRYPKLVCRSFGN